MEDTIVAISTALGKGAIAIIRLSGKDSINIVNIEESRRWVKDRWKNIYIIIQV